MIVIPRQKPESKLLEGINKGHGLPVGAERSLGYGRKREQLTLFSEKGGRK